MHKVHSTSINGIIKCSFERIDRNNVLGSLKSENVSVPTIFPDVMLEVDY